MTNALYLFTDDLRIHDNPLLSQAALSEKNQICAFCFPETKPLDHFGNHTIGEHRKNFLLQCL